MLPLVLLHTLAILIVALAGMRGRGPLAPILHGQASPAWQPRWAWPLAHLAAVAASFPLLAQLPVLLGRDSLLVSDAGTHAAVANAVAVDGLPHGWVDVYNGGFPFGIHYQSVGYLLLAGAIRLGVSPTQAIQGAGLTALVALPPLVVWSARRLSFTPGCATIAAWIVAWVSPVNAFVGGWEQYLSMGLLAQVLGLLVALVFVTTVVRDGPTWPVLPLSALLVATHPQIATCTLTLVALAIPFAGGAWRRRFAVGVVASGAWLLAIYGHGLASLALPFGFPPHMAAWRQIGFDHTRAADLLTGDLYDQRRLPVLSAAWIFASSWLVAFSARPAARALLAVSVGGFALSVSGAALFSLGRVGAALGAFVMPLRLMALFPLVAAASVAMAATELTRRQRPRMARPLLMLGLGAALVGFALPERWQWAQEHERARTVPRLEGGSECGPKTPEGFSANAMRSWVAELDRGRVTFDLAQPARNCLVMHGVELRARVPRGQSAGAVTHLGTLVEAFASLRPGKPGSGARAEALGVRHVVFTGADAPPPSEPFVEVHRRGATGLATRVGGTDTVGVGCIAETWSGSDRALRAAIVERLRATPSLLDQPTRLVAVELGSGELVRSEVASAGCNPAGARVEESPREPGAYEATVHTASPVDVVVRATAYAGWRVSVDGSPAPWRMVAPGFFAVRVPAGEHDVEAVVSLPRSFIGGLLVVLLGTVALTIVLARRERLIGRR